MDMMKAALEFRKAMQFFAQGLDARSEERRVGKECAA